MRHLIYCLDDELPILEVYDYALTPAGYDVKCFTRGEDLLTESEKIPPDLYILDIMLDGIDGYGVLSEIRKRPALKDLPVIMVSAKTAETDKVKGLNLGADDYIEKPFGIMELVARVGARFRRTAVKPSGASYKDIVVDDNAHKITVGGKELVLTLKQYELLRFFVNNAEKVFSRDELLDAVWGENYGETRTLDIFVSDLRKKLADSQAEISTIRGLGYVLGSRHD